MSILPVTNSYRLSGSLNGISHSVLEMALSHLLDIYRAIGASQYLPVPKRACSRLTPFPVARLLRTCWFVNRVRDCHDFLPLRYKDGTTLLFKPSTEISSVTSTQIYYSDSTERRGHRAKTQIKVKQLYFEAYQKIAIGEGDAIA